MSKKESGFKSGGSIVSSKLDTSMFSQVNSGRLSEAGSINSSQRGAGQQSYTENVRMGDELS